MSASILLFEKIRRDILPVISENLSGTDILFPPMIPGFLSDDFEFLNPNVYNEANSARINVARAAKFANMVNVIPRGEDFFEISAQSIDQLDTLLLNHLKNLEIATIENADIQRLWSSAIFKDILEKLVSSDSVDLYRERFIKYLSIQERLKEIMDSVELSLDKKLLSIKPLTEELDNFVATWNTESSKNEVEEKILSILNKEIGSFIKIKDDMKSKLSASRESFNNNTYTPTLCSPSDLYKGTSKSWKTYKLTEKDIVSLRQSLSTSEYKNISAELINLSITEISFDLLIMEIKRPWNDRRFLSSPYWNLSTIHEDNRIPSTVDKLILARNVNITIAEPTHNKTVAGKPLMTMSPFFIKPTLANIYQLKAVFKPFKSEVGNTEKVKKKLSKTKSKPLISTNQMKILKPQVMMIKNVKTVGVKRPISKNIFKKVEFTIITKKSETLKLKQEYFSTVQNNNVLNISPQITQNKAIFTLKTDIKYEVAVNVPDYKPIQHKFTVQENINKIQIVLDKEPEEFMLIAAISTLIDTYPNPIEGLQYI